MTSNSNLVDQNTFFGASALESFVPKGLRSLLEPILDGVQIWSGQGKLLYANPATHGLFGLAPGTPLRGCKDLLRRCHQPDGTPVEPRSFSVCALSGELEGDRERVFLVDQEDGRKRWVRIRAHGLPDREGRTPPRWVISTCFDVTAFVLQAHRLEAQAQYDALTHLPNRLLFSDRLNLALATAERRRETLAVCMLDLDGFKPVNDSLGHQAGDLVLQEIANRLATVLRADDTAARLGGDEFGLLIGGLHEPSECEPFLTRVLDHLARPMDIQGHRVAVTASIGVTLFPGDARDPEQLLRHADQAMYKAKEAGKGRFEIFDSAIAGKLRASHMLMRQIQQAIDGGQFTLFYQPMVDCRQGKVVGLEALVRWQHPVLGMRLPGEFLPLIQHDDAIVRLGEWVIREALHQVGRWQAEGIVQNISVNVAPRQFLRADFATRLGQLLLEHSPEASSHLAIEMVETTALEDVGAVSLLIRHFREHGVKFHLDDFGTGYSSLVHLKRLAADALKIDQAFVRDMLKGPGDLTIVQGVVNLARTFNMDVVAEGVEDIEQLLTLLDLGCNVMQGNAIARPMPADRVAHWLGEFKPDPRWTLAQGPFPGRHGFELLLGQVIHRFWRHQVLSAVREPSRPWPELDEQKCRLAVWDQDTARWLFSHHPAYARFQATHAKVHEIARQLREASLAAEGQTGPLRKAFETSCEALLGVIASFQR